MTPDDPPSQPPRAADSPQPHALAYFPAPVGPVVFTEAGLELLKRARPWTLLTAIVLYIGGGIGVLLAMWVAFLLVYNPAARGSANAIVGGGALFFGVAALAAGALVTWFIRAARRADQRRQPEDFERLLLALLWLWRWLLICLIGTLAYPFIVLFVAALLNIWP